MAALPLPQCDRFDSLEQLYEALTAHRLPRVRGGGTVRVHPERFVRSGIAGILDARRQVGAHGLVLALTPAVGVETVELRYAARGSWVPGTGHRRSAG